MSNRAEIIITLNAKGQREVQAAFGGVRKEAGELNNSVGLLGRGAYGLATTFSRVLGPAVAGLGLITLSKQMVDVSAKFQTLNASLITVTGSQAAANENFAWLQDFAAETPFQLDQVVGAFIKMESLGLNPTREALTSFGNTASAMGKNLNQMIEAVADASVGEFERLKEFGIKARSEGENIKFTFNGVTTTIRKDAADITKYLQQLGDTKFAGGMSRQMETIGGSMSNLSDSWDYFLVSLGKTGPIDAAADSFNTLSTALRNFGQSFELFKAYQDGKIGFWDFLTANPEDAKKLLEQTAGMDAQLIKLQNTVKELKSDKAGNFWWSAADESELQQAQQALEFYKLSLGDVDRLKQAALSNTFVPSDMSPEKPGKKTKKPDSGIEYGAGLWETQAAEKYEVMSRSTEALLELDRMAAAEKALLFQYGDDMWLQSIDSRVEAETRGIEMILDAEKAAADAKVQMQTNAMNATMGILSALQSGAMQNSKKGFEIAKMAAIAETTINTYKAATGAYSALASIPYVGPALGIAAAAAAVAAGMANVNAIKSQKFGGGSGAGGASNIGTPNFNGAPNSPLVTTPGNVPAAQQQTKAERATEVNVVIHAGASMMDRSSVDEFARVIADSIAKTKRDGY